MTLRGETAHAGTTPLGLRRDAVQDMVRAITALNSLMADPADVLRFTVGRIVVSPNTSNSVADRASFSIDFRHPDAAVLGARGDAIAGVVQAAVRDAQVSVEESFHALPVSFAPIVVDAVQRAADALGLGAMRMPSGAFHDAQFAVPVCPDRDAVRALPRRGQPQPGRVCRAGAARRRRARAGAGARGAGRRRVTAKAAARLIG